MNKNQAFLRGVPAMLLGVVGGGAVLGIAGFGFARSERAPDSVAFVVGIGCGYLMPLVLRIGAFLGPMRVRRYVWLRWGLLAVGLFPLVSSAVAFAVVPLPVALGFGVGALAMFFLGLALVPEPLSHVANASKSNEDPRSDEV